jgi:hypothetical protein
MKMVKKTWNSFKSGSKNNDLIKLKIISPNTFIIKVNNFILSFLILIR